MKTKKKFLPKKCFSTAFLPGTSTPVIVETDLTSTNEGVKASGSVGNTLVHSPEIVLGKKKAEITIDGKTLPCTHANAIQLQVLLASMYGATAIPSHVIV